jgi:hypothetical protein
MERNTLSQNEYALFYLGNNRLTSKSIKLIASFDWPRLIKVDLSNFDPIQVETN